MGYGCMDTMRYERCALSAEAIKGYLFGEG